MFSKKIVKSKVSFISHLYITFKKVMATNYILLFCIKNFFNYYFVSTKHFHKSLESIFNKLRFYNLVKKDIIKFNYYYLNTNFRERFKNFFKLLLNKFMSSGCRFISEHIFKPIMNSPKNTFFFKQIHVAIEFLKPRLNLKIFEIKSKGKKRSIKKEDKDKEKKKLKIIPEKIGPFKGYKIALNWIIHSISSNYTTDQYLSILNEFFSVNLGWGKSLVYKKNFYKTAGKNRMSFHFRWKKNIWT